MQHDVLSDGRIVTCVRQHGQHDLGSTQDVLGCSQEGQQSVTRAELGRLPVQVYPGRTALVVSLENITENVYLGNQRSMTITNCLFRLGGAAALLSNKRRHWWTARSAQSVADMRFPTEWCP